MAASYETVRERRIGEDSLAVLEGALGCELGFVGGMEEGKVSAGSRDRRRRPRDAGVRRSDEFVVCWRPP